MTQKIQDIRERAKRALLVSLSEDACLELTGLAETLELDIAGKEIINIREKQPKYGMGSGKAEELSLKAKELKVDCLVFDFEISPSQQRNWEELAEISVLDRQELIIQIFASRALTREADLQVQLALLHYRLPRLTHKYINLSQQRGGRYGSKGKGETKLETDRRRIEKEINKLEKEIEQVTKQRSVNRRRREKQGLPVCAIVGYTNAGKSSLLNALTGSDVFVENKLFATLDATTRRLVLTDNNRVVRQPGWLPHKSNAEAQYKTVLLTDTVGFIRRLPHSLIKAFRSTLEEASHSNLLLHVLDASDPNVREYYNTTVSVLAELGAGEIPVITVLNKIDLLKETLDFNFPNSVEISVKTGIGLDKLKEAVREKIFA